MKEITPEQIQRAKEDVLARSRGFKIVDYDVFRLRNKQLIVSRFVIQLLCLIMAFGLGVFVTLSALIQAING